MSAGRKVKYINGSGYYNNGEITEFENRGISYVIPTEHTGYFVEIDKGNIDPGVFIEDEHGCIIRRELNRVKFSITMHGEIRM